MTRPESYQYLEIFTDHLDNDSKRVFNDKVIYPRQLEIHLPADRKTACNFHCHYCQGLRVAHLLSSWEEDALKVVDGLKGASPYHIFGGVYTEPLMNEYFPSFLKLTKKYNNHFGIHTNGSLFEQHERTDGLGTLITSIATSPLDYVSVSLDGGTVASHSKVKNVKEDFFTRIIEGIRILVKLRGERKFPSIRVCYLMTRFNSAPEEIAGIVKMMKDIGVDSLRFSVPYDHYGKSFERVRNYRNGFEIPFGEKCAEIVKPHCSASFKEKPYVFWHPPGYQDVEKMNFKQCVYSYYQITFGADGWMYKCSSTAAPDFAHARLGKIPNNIEDFNRMVLANHNGTFEARTCFSVGARCNRIALEINQAWNKGELFPDQQRVPAAPLHETIAGAPVEAFYGK